ncbi:MAG: acyl-CoA dehydrogenase family protein, partial [Thermodesulfobacteriota bacterium]
MDFHLSPELTALQLKVRQFVTDELVPLEVETELAEGRLLPDVRDRLIRRVKELGLNAMALPHEMGGRAFSWVAQT